MYKLRQIWLAAMANFQRWKNNPQIMLAFSLAFVICFLLSDKVIVFAKEHNAMLQITEPFIWTFGDAESALIISLILLLLFADLPNLGNEVPLFLIRITRRVWILGQILYLTLATTLMTGFIFLSTVVLTSTKAYTANLWSDTAAILGYSEIGSQIAVPSFVKALELSFPYECALHIFWLMLGYSVLMAGIILYLNLRRENGGMIGGIIFSVFGFLFSPTVIAQLLRLPDERIKIANIIFGWISPLNHATYCMHNFGYDNLPKLQDSYLYFTIGSIIIFTLCAVRIKNINFSFTGTEKR